MWNTAVRHAQIGHGSRGARAILSQGVMETADALLCVAAPQAVTGAAAECACEGGTCRCEWRPPLRAHAACILVPPQGLEP
eukprot:3168667-Prymnesium_polylepis.1